MRPLGGGGLASARIDNVLTGAHPGRLDGVSLSGVAAGSTASPDGAGSRRSLLLALAVGVIVVGYRFAIFLVTLYTT